MPSCAKQRLITCCAVTSGYEIGLQIDLSANLSMLQLIMNLKYHKPVTQGRRGLVTVDRSHLSKTGPEKSLTVRITRTGGRNNYGRITAWHRGGGARRLYRMVDFKRERHDKAATVRSLEYDPNRTAFIALLEREGKKSYIVAPDGIRAGDVVGGNEITPGMCATLADIPSGTKVHNIEFRPGMGARAVRSAGTFAQVLGIDGDLVAVRLPSGQIRKLSKQCTAVVGAVSNAAHMNITDAKAGRTRWKGWRPVVRGTAMNSRCHKHGGGRGKAKGCHPVTPWGKKTKGLKTRSKSKPRLI